MPKDSYPPLDAEKTPTDRLLRTFRPPPDLDPSNPRSTLLVGTRGSGKTTFLRHCLHTTSPAFLADLRKILNPISSETGTAGLNFSAIPPSLEHPIQNKALLLIAFWIIQKSLDLNLPVALPNLSRMLPSNVRADLTFTDAESFASASANLMQKRLTEFRNEIPLDFLLEFLERIVDTSGSALILLDRAEEIPYPSLSPVLKLLDQSSPFTTIVTTRPGILGPAMLLSPDLPTPGDHYDIRHLGSQPYSKDWHLFQSAVLESWIPHTFRAIPTPQLRLLSFISRDSIRHALELAFNSLDGDGKFNEDRSQYHINLLRSALMSASQGILRSFNDELEETIRKIRRSWSPVEHPIKLLLDKDAHLMFPKPIQQMSRQEKFVRLALRTGFFVMPHGEVWHPYSVLDAVEIPGLFIWRPGELWSGISNTA